VKSFISINKTPDISATTLWETAKVVMRGNIISYSTYKHKKEKKLEKDLEDKIKILHQTYSQNQNEQILNEINQTKNQLDSITNKKIEFYKQRLRLIHFEYKDKSGKYLANLLKRNKEKTHISTIKNENKIIHNLQDINTTFQTFYKIM